jgi:peptidoglycan/xylan/chitin deacetylase (PgdA/CDA1 family)
VKPGHNLATAVVKPSSNGEAGPHPATPANGTAVTQLLFFWDYDTQWGADRSRSGGGPKTWGPWEFENTERLLELHAQYQVPACFAVVGAAALAGARPYHDPDQIRRIHAAGHEIASHSFKHEWLPGLGPRALRDTLRSSKEALEQCIGASVVSLVPPYNQPFDHARGLSFSWAERREARTERTDLLRLCEALSECGYQFCRVAYRPMQQRLAEALLNRRLDRPSVIERIAGIDCVRLNTPGGFDGETRDMVEQSAGKPGIVVVYGHPHSLRTGNSQDETWLVPFFEVLQRLMKAGFIQAVLPKDLLRRR